MSGLASRSTRGEKDRQMAKAVTLIRSNTLSDAAEYAYAATAPADARLIFVAGACPLNADGTTAAVGDYAGQATKAVENMRVILAEVGASIEDVISTRVLVASSRQADPGHYVERRLPYWIGMPRSSAWSLSVFCSRPRRTQTLTVPSASDTPLATSPSRLPAPLHITIRGIGKPSRSRPPRLR